ncbi:nucleotidyltransferase family protein [Sulfurimonas sp.]|uniref:nucleotidyltransferase family protein n=1 Tax=Sulfurimonas sp. TaxID=2022749 RepID=UPI002620DBE8|nr:nucleotidyltransferase family protein [Sulfurimonas sp.]MDD5156445.1 nucleotidyltransferase family protein [Sulfurimonas sp.]
MKNIQNIKLKPTATIREALAVIDSGAMQIAIVVDDENRLLGTLTDGNIRRGLLSGLSVDGGIKDIYFKTPTVAKMSDTKEEILKVALAKKLHQIPIVNELNCVLGIVEIDELIKPKDKTNRVVLMAGGLGTRLGELTKTTPKPMLHVGNKPILQTIIENFSKYGYTNIIISVNYLSHVIEDYFGDGSTLGVSIEYIHEKERMGTAGALSLMRNLLKEPFFVMNGDLLTNVNFEHLHDFHKSQEAIGTMGVREYDFQVPYGVVNIEDGRISSITEKPTHKFFVSAGIYMLSPKALSLIPDGEFFDMPSLFEKIINEDNKALSFPIHEYWLDIGRINDYEQANSEYYEVF